MSTTKSTATVYYLPDYAAQGGPPFTGPVEEDTQLVLDETTAAVALLYMESGPTAGNWVVMDVANGSIYAEATNPGDLASWLNDYAAELGDMHARGEL